MVSCLRRGRVGHAGAPAMLGMPWEGSGAGRPQGFWFPSQPPLFWPGASTHPSIRPSVCPSHSPPRLRRAPLLCGAVRTLGGRRGCPGGFFTPPSPVGREKVMPRFLVMLHENPLPLPTGLGCTKTSLGCRSHFEGEKPGCWTKQKIR